MSSIMLKCTFLADLWVSFERINRSSIGSGARGLKIDLAAPDPVPFEQQLSLEHATREHHAPFQRAYLPISGIWTEIYGDRAGFLNL